MEDLLQPLSLFFLYHAFQMRRKALAYCVNMDLLRLKRYWKCFQFKQQHLSYLLVLFFVVVVLSKFNGDTFVIVVVCTFDFHKDGSKSIH